MGKNIEIMETDKISLIPIQNRPETKFPQPISFYFEATQHLLIRQYIFLPVNIF